MNRAFRAAILDGRLYDELTDEPEEIFYALAIVILSGATVGIGIQFMELPKWEGAPQWLFVAFSVWARVVGWFMWAGVAFIVGTKAFGGQAGYRRLLRSIGLTFVPGVLPVFPSVLAVFGSGVLAVFPGVLAVFPSVLAVFGWIPVVGIVLTGLSFLWMFPAALVAIRETQKLNWIQAAICTIIGWCLYVALLMAVFQFTRVTPA